MKDDKDELDKMERADVRLGRVPPRDEVIHRGSGAMHEATGAAPSAGHGGAESSNPKAEKEAGAPAGAEQEAGAPAAEAEEIEAQEGPRDEEGEERERAFHFKEWNLGK